MSSVSLSLCLSLFFFFLQILLCRITWRVLILILFNPIGSVVVQLCLTLCDPMDCSMPGFPFLHHLLEFAETHVHWVVDAIQPSNPLSSPSPPGFYLSIIRVFSNDLTFHIRWPKYWSFSFSISPPNEYSGFISFRIDRLISWLSKGLSRVFSNTTAQKHQSFGALPSVSWEATVHI